MRILFLLPTDSEEVKDLINSMEFYKAAGSNSIPTRILKNFKKQLSISLSQLINLSFNKGTFPSFLVLAKIISIYRKGDRQDSNNYRPISLLSNLSKMIEKLIHKRLYSFFYHCDCSFTYQFRFRNHSQHALISITEKIRKDLDEAKFACSVFSDLQKTFDKNNHESFLATSQHGVRGVLLNWFKSLLDLRKFCQLKM